MNQTSAIFTSTSQSSLEGITFNNEIYRVGDFVYIEPKERGLEPHIILVMRLWFNSDNVAMLFGNWFYRPNETYHLPTRRFLQKVSDTERNVPSFYVSLTRDEIDLNFDS